MAHCSVYWQLVGRMLSAMMIPEFSGNNRVAHALRPLPYVGVPLAVCEQATGHFEYLFDLQAKLMNGYGALTLAGTCWQVFPRGICLP